MHSLGAATEKALLNRNSGTQLDCKRVPKCRVEQHFPWLSCDAFSFVADPFFPLSFLINSWFPGMLDDLFQSLFLCALLLFWLCVYHGIRVQVRRRHIFQCYLHSAFHTYLLLCAYVCALYCFLLDKHSLSHPLKPIPNKQFWKNLKPKE